ncbi:carbamoyl-phosphate synthase L chain, N-terminal domain protein [Mycobacterium xenopi 3993]|nr:carbamoyl-phosphate synthase L chain, N-terminal domain protein [Mycobacterium xenopi 3993]
MRLADEAFALGGQTSAESYLDFGKLLDAAEKSGANAIHPGYGFLSENADFAQAVIDAGLIWIGPSPQSIRDLGDKVTARHIAARAQAPLVPGTPTRSRTPTRWWLSPTSTACRSRSRPRSAAAARA